MRPRPWESSSLTEAHRRHGAWTNGAKGSHVLLCLLSRYAPWAGETKRQKPDTRNPQDTHATRKPPGGRCDPWRLSHQTNCLGGGRMDTETVTAVGGRLHTSLRYSGPGGGPPQGRQLQGTDQHLLRFGSSLIKEALTRRGASSLTCDQTVQPTPCPRPPCRSGVVLTNPVRSSPGQLLLLLTPKAPTWGRAVSWWQDLRRDDAGPHEAEGLERRLQEKPASGLPAPRALPPRQSLLF